MVQFRFTIVRKPVSKCEVANQFWYVFFFVFSIASRKFIVNWKSDDEMALPIHLTIFPDFSFRHQSIHCWKSVEIGMVNRCFSSIPCLRCAFLGHNLGGFWEQKSNDSCDRIGCDIAIRFDASHEMSLSK